MNDVPTTSNVKSEALSVVSTGPPSDWWRTKALWVVVAPAAGAARAVPARNPVGDPMMPAASVTVPSGATTANPPWAVEVDGPMTVGMPTAVLPEKRGPATRIEWPGASVSVPSAT